MFTGIVEELGMVKRCETVPTEWGDGARLTLAARKVDNIELDIVAKQIERLLEPYRP